jgi:LysM repeat protein
MMCHQPVDSLPLSSSVFSGSWSGIILGVLIIVGIVVGVSYYQGNVDQVAQAVENTPTLTPTTFFTPTATGTPTPTRTITPTPTPTPRVHVVERGQTLIFVAQLYGVPLDTLINLNNIEDVRALSVGQTLLIPPEASRVGGSDRLPAQMVYVIEEGDTLSSIAYERGTTIEAIMAANPDINLDLIFPGQELVVPLSTPTPTLTPTPLPTKTPTPGPRHVLPDLLSPPDGQVVTGSTLLLNWTSTGLLADDEFYVVQLFWPNSVTQEHWTQASAWRISKEQRPAKGLVTWNVAIMRQTGTTPQGTPSGIYLALPGPPHVFEWR